MSKNKITFIIIAIVILFALILTIVFLSLSNQKKTEKIENLKLEVNCVTQELKVTTLQLENQEQIQEEFIPPEIKEPKELVDEENLFYTDIFNRFNTWRLPKLKN